VPADAEEALLERLGLELDILDAGCCGLAGSFGYERGGHYDHSMKVGERVLFAAVRAAPEHALFITDGSRAGSRSLTAPAAVHCTPPCSRSRCERN
jgi:hypothetical protein